jgi:hypothetical protein
MQAKPDLTGQWMRRSRMTGPGVPYRTHELATSLMGLGGRGKGQGWIVRKRLG